MGGNYFFGLAPKPLWQQQAEYENVTIRVCRHRLSKKKKNPEREEGRREIT